MGASASYALSFWSGGTPSASGRRRGAEHEYDSYALPLARKLREGVDAHDVAVYLNGIELENDGAARLWSRQRGNGGSHRAVVHGVHRDRLASGIVSGLGFPPLPWNFFRSWCAHRARDAYARAARASLASGPLRTRRRIGSLAHDTVRRRPSCRSSASPSAREGRPRG